MEKREQVTNAIGEKAFEMLIEEISDGLITTDHLKQIALLMKGGVHGVYMAKKDCKEVVYVFRAMMDKWYSTTLYKKEVPAFDKLINILEDPMVEKGELAERMKQIPKKMMIGLPDIILPQH
jgi:hypothetical protein